MYLYGGNCGMAMIKCPECGKEISDKSEKCINCGYPISILLPAHEIINGKDIDLSFLKDDSLSQIAKVDLLHKKSGCDIFKAKEIVLKYCPSKKEQGCTRVQVSGQTKCKKCGCIEFTPVRRKWSPLMGFATNKIELICNNCGTKAK